MKIIEGFKLRTVMGQSVIVGEGIKQINFNKLVSLNESAALMWQAVEGRDFTVADLTKVLLDNYDIDKATAQADAAQIAQDWIDNGLVEA